MGVAGCLCTLPAGTLGNLNIFVDVCHTYRDSEEMMAKKLQGSSTMKALGYNYLDAMVLQVDDNLEVVKLFIQILVVTKMSSR